MEPLLGRDIFPAMKLAGDLEGERLSRIEEVLGIVPLF